jgi:hypothetical protein
MYATVRDIPVTQPRSLKARSAFVVMTSLLVGTGSSYGMERAEAWKNYVQPRVAFPLATTNERRENVVNVDVRSPAEHLENIRTVFNPAVADLAALFEVSRQSIYKWLAKDSVPEEEKLARITALSQIADTMNQAGISRAGALLKMKLFDGQSLLDLVKVGKNCTEQVRALIAEAQKMEAAYDRSGLAQSKAKPTNDWQSSVSIPFYSEAG